VLAAVVRVGSAGLFLAKSQGTSYGQADTGTNLNNISSAYQI
jgi:hypothetical protein